MTVERRLADALAEFDRVEPSPDLFARVQGSMVADRTHRRLVVRSSVGALVAATAAVALVGTVVERGSDGSLFVPGWPILVGEVLTLATLVVVLGPTIGRFGGVYVSDVFRLAPETGLRFQRLLDVAYYLVFCGYVLTVVSLRQVGEQVLLTARLRGTLDRVAGLLLLMGVLHALTLAVLPIVGLVASSVFRRDRRRRAGDRAPLPSPMAQQAERVARVMVWVGVGSVVAMTLVGLGMLAGIGVGG